MFLVAGWYGLWRQKRSGDDWSFSHEKAQKFGYAMRAALIGENKDARAGLERHLGRLLSADDDGMAALMPRMVERMAKERNVYIDWGSLLYDVANWGGGPIWVGEGHGRRHPSKEWAKQFWWTEPSATSARPHVDESKQSLEDGETA
jgi:hypothetical protein